MISLFTVATTGDHVAYSESDLLYAIEAVIRCGVKFDDAALASCKGRELRDVRLEEGRIVVEVKEIDE